MTRIGFVVLSHDQPARLGRLLGRLVDMFGSPPIVCHHDFAKEPLDPSGLPPCARLVEPHVPVRWGTFSMIDAARTGLRALYDTPDPPDWFVLLSAADYPVRPASQILADLEGSGVDGFLELLEVDPGSPEAQRHPHREFVRRYFPGGARPPAPCYAGEFWITGNARCAERLLGRSRIVAAIEGYYRCVQCPDESFFQTALASDPSLRLHPYPKRYVDWREAWRTGGPHPKTLGVADLDSIRASGAHFARKFDPRVDEVVLDRLDQLVAA